MGRADGHSSGGGNGGMGAAGTTRSATAAGGVGMQGMAEEGAGKMAPGGDSGRRGWRQHSSRVAYHSRGRHWAGRNRRGQQEKRGSRAGRAQAQKEGAKGRARAMVGDRQQKLGGNGTSHSHGRSSTQGGGQKDTYRQGKEGKEQQGPWGTGA